MISSCLYKNIKSNSTNNNNNDEKKHTDDKDRIQIVFSTMKWEMICFVGLCVGAQLFSTDYHV